MCARVEEEGNMGQTPRRESCCSRYNVRQQITGLTPSTHWPINNSFKNNLVAVFVVVGSTVVVVVVVVAFL